MVTIALSQQLQCCADCDVTSSRLVIETWKHFSSITCKDGFVAVVDSFSIFVSSGVVSVAAVDGQNDPYTNWGASQQSCFKSAQPLIGNSETISVIVKCESAFCKIEKSKVSYSCKEISRNSLQVLSDIDDTIACSNGALLAGVDVRIERAEIYPGLLELDLALAVGANPQNDLPRTFLTLSARPDLPFLSIKKTSELYLRAHAVGQQNKFDDWGSNTADSMYGSLASGTSFPRMGLVKGNSFISYATNHPNVPSFAFFGDNGQGDACAGQIMLESQFSNKVAFILIHEVQTKEAEVKTCNGNKGQFQLTLRGNAKALYHTNYAVAALWLLQKGFISVAGANMVVEGMQKWIACRCNSICDNFVFTGAATKASVIPVQYCLRITEDVKTLQRAATAVANAADSTNIQEGNILNGNSNDNNNGINKSLEIAAIVLGCVAFVLLVAIIVGLFIQSGKHEMERV